MRARVKTLLVATCALAALLGGGVAPAQAAPQRLSIIAMPHPDDESMAASQFQSASDNYQVFVTFTRGEQTGNCIPSNYAATYNPELGELPASNAPVQQFQPSCENSRLDGLRNFLTQMGPAVPSLPSSFGPVANHTLPSNGAALCRFDGKTTCLNAQAVSVWHDSGGRGSIVAFNLGDGDLTSAEVVWAINGLMQNRTTLLPDATDAYPLYNVIGPYWYNGSDPACEPYPNADHRAVHDALWATSFGAVYNSAATCASDPDRTVLATVNDAYWNAAFTAQTGAFHRHYGWLWPGSWQTDRNGQGEWFHGVQAFWRRF